MIDLEIETDFKRRNIYKIEIMSNMGITSFYVKKNIHTYQERKKHSSAAYNTSHCFWNLFSANTINKKPDQRQNRDKPNHL